MTTKPPLFAIIFALPFNAMAGYNMYYYDVPAQVEENGIVVMTNDLGPYQTVTIGADDDEHIASTAYVKGAYNDTIAAINTIGNIALTAQSVIISGDTESLIESETLSAGGLIEDLSNGPDLEFSGGYLVTGYAVAVGIKSQRAEVWTTWDDDTAKTEVAFVTASGNN